MSDWKDEKNREPRMSIPYQSQVSQVETMATNTREMTQQEKIEELFRYHPPRPDQVPRYETIRNAGKYLAQVIISNTQRGSDQSKAIRKLREAVMAANSSIALDGLNF
jgi:hypothetical protein